MNRNNLITIKTFTYPNEAAIIRSKLESEGIYCFIQDELTTQIYPLASNAFGGAKLQVREEDVEQAIQIMKEAEMWTEDENLSNNEDIQTEETVSKSAMRCPYCGSFEVSKNSLSGKVFAFSILLLGFPIPFISRIFHCFDCGHDFKKKKG